MAQNAHLSETTCPLATHEISLCNMSVSGTNHLFMTCLSATWKILCSCTDSVLRRWLGTQVWHLASLPSLKRLLLSDPDWGASPVACLCNYATYAAVNLPGLHALDSQVLTSHTKAVAGATYLRKKMYYNMRIHTLRRKAAALVQQAKQGLQVLYTTGLLHVVNMH